MMTFKLHHLHLICRDLEGMIRFWTNGVGAEFKEYRKFGSADGAVLRLDILQVNLRVPNETEQADSGKNGVIGYDHLGLIVEDVDAAIAHLAEFGCRIKSEPAVRGEWKVAFLTCPEDLTLELMQQV